jgi:hypothetical protein
VAGLPPARSITEPNQTKSSKYSCFAGLLFARPVIKSNKKGLTTVFSAEWFYIVRLPYELFDKVLLQKTVIQLGLLPSKKSYMT